MTEAAKPTFEEWVGGGHDVDELSVIGKSFVGKEDRELPGGFGEGLFFL